MAWNDETILQESPVLLAELEQLELNNLEGFDFTDPPAGPEVPGGMDEGAIGGTPAEQILAVLPDPITAQLLAQVGQDVAPGLSALMVTAVPSSDFPCEDGGEGEIPGEVTPYETPEGDPDGWGVGGEPVTQFGVLASDVALEFSDSLTLPLDAGVDSSTLCGEATYPRPLAPWSVWSPPVYTCKVTRYTLSNGNWVESRCETWIDSRTRNEGRVCAYLLPDVTIAFINQTRLAVETRTTKCCVGGILANDPAPFCPPGLPPRPSTCQRYSVVIETTYSAWTPPCP